MNKCILTSIIIVVGVLIVAKISINNAYSNAVKHECGEWVGGYISPDRFMWYTKDNK